jgi:hypothetical protein
MRIEGLRIDDDDTLHFELIGENQMDSALIYEAAQRMLKPITCYGSVNGGCLWAWFIIPLKKNWTRYFGNEKD